MNIPLRWLGDYVPLKVTPEELARRLATAGLAVEEIRRFPAELDWDKVYVGQVVKLDRHPDADRLILATVNYGQPQPLTVVTGAPNLHEGAKVPFAMSGAQLYNGHSEAHEITVLRPTKMRGIMSEGMVCSELELGISDEHEGIMLLPDDAPVGVPLLDYLGDYVIELELTPNLGRALSAIGTAREVAALTWEEGARVHYPEDVLHASGPDMANDVTVTAEDVDLCPRYSGLLVRGVKVGPSPAWMQERLLKAGMRPINNVVDISNYVMLEWGQPLHTFDLQKCVGKQIIVRRARPGETVEGIDHTIYKLDEQMLLICDAEKPIGIAGVMGGANSEIDESSHDIFIESAHFAPLSVRRTARRLGLHTEASHRFERTVDPAGTLRAARRCAEFLREVASGEIANGEVDIYPNPQLLKQITLITREVARLVGMEFSLTAIMDLLARLEFGLEPPADGQSVLVTVPSYRNDVNIPADLVEEVARMYGYDNLPTTSLDTPLPPEHPNRSWEFEERVRDIMTGLGLDEVINYSLQSRRDIDLLWQQPDEVIGEAGGVGLTWFPADRKREPLRLFNPLSSEREYLRVSLLPGLFHNLADNLRHSERVALFEIAHVFYSNGDEQLPDEPHRLSGVMCGPREPRSRYYPNGGEPLDYFDAKGIVEGLLTHLEFADVAFSHVQDASGLLHSGRSAAVLVNGLMVGIVAEMHPAAAAQWDLPSPPQRVALFDLDADALFTLTMQAAEQKYRPISKFPTVRQDLALIVDENVPAGQVQRLIEQTGGRNLAAATLFDVYTGAPIPPGKKSLAYSLTFQSYKSTFSEEEINNLRGRIVARLNKEVGAVLRG